MRDVVIALFIFGMVPLMIRRPWIGVMMWVWISVMNPHKFAWGFVSTLPVAMVAGVATLIGMVVSRDRVRLPFNSTTVLLILFPLWMTLTLVFAFHFADAVPRWIEVMKIFLFILIAAAVLHTRKHIETLIWVLVFSIGFFGIKGGLFTLLSGGGNRVYGPPGESFLSDNNAISVALIMIIPLAHYLAMHVKRRVISLGLYGCMALSAVAVLGSQSRGAFLGIVVMVSFLWLKSRRKVLLGILVLAALPLAIVTMPDSWKNRMRTVETYEEDPSALGRLNAWQMAFNVANDRPLIGGGFELYSKETFARYAPDPDDVHAAHSIYFQILGEHGYVGLLLFLSLGVVGWLNARRITRESKGRPDFTWAADLARSMQVSLIGFAAGGAFVNIGYWELPYYELVMLMLTLRLVRGESVTKAAPAVGSPGTAKRAEIGTRA